MMKIFELQWRYDVDKRAVALGVATMALGLTGLYFAGQAQQKNEVGARERTVASVALGKTDASKKPIAPLTKQDAVKHPTEFATADATLLAADLDKPVTGDSAKRIPTENVAAIDQATANVNGPMVGEAFVMRREDVVEEESLAGNIATDDGTATASHTANTELSVETRAMAVAEDETVIAVTSEDGKDESVAASKSVDVIHGWSAAKLERIRNKKARQHRFAKEFPDHAIVVCEAGCRDKVEHVVFKKPKPSRYAERQARMIATASADTDIGARAPSSAINCLAGCYRTPRSYHARRQAKRVARRAQRRTAVRRSWR